MAKYDIRDFLDLTRALSDENRVRVLLALDQGELCVCQITELLDLAPSTVSKHMAILKQARLVDLRKEGRWVYYRLACPKKGPVAEALEWVRRSLTNAGKVLEDRRFLEELTCIEPATLTQIQRERSGP